MSCAWSQRDLFGIDTRADEKAVSAIPVGLKCETR
jgi:hypothetical protein